jgi:hypothetical protein
VDYKIEIKINENQAHQLNKLGINKKIHGDEKIVAHIIQKVTDKLAEDDFDILRDIGIV